jgi:hypothetical protein
MSSGGWDGRRMLSWIRNILESSSGADNWQRWWDARIAALEAVLGKCDGTVYHAPPPMHLDGYADVLRFRSFVAGVTYVTCDLIGNPRHAPNNLGHYELMMCTREESGWAPGMLSRLAKYTHEAALQIGDTMDITRVVPGGSTAAALLFTTPDIQPARFEVLGQPATILLCIGITAEEFSECKSHNSRSVHRELADKGIYPYTDLKRDSATRV